MPSVFFIYSHETYRRVGVYSLTSSATRTLIVPYKDKTNISIYQIKIQLFSK